ncbi:MULTISPECIES: glutamyl-tRNA reductase [unclassified Corynebacterium]|uniref:glutamyl-tRNA reductase n=1 Tax=unclassified Corynebacterium TaxID=2624378 RepID=UPI0029C9FC21|nr:MULTISPECIES: glutamyl-tRNA reductase [unclassified Corynebacterium]WPF67232.1 glutamyl-tRNA reductase [Corynebacterium sp. 22KM0430]WPF69721.1 glutamyl-tRNA reductase [Corynebacterium sp. 21KM1197]
MSVLVVGMSHRSAPVELLEKLSMDDAVREEATSLLLERPALSEAMIISTCNRLEVYSVATGFHPGVQDVVSVLHEVSGVDMDTLRGYLYVRYAEAAAEHMMEVASGLDSMVVGEQQIIGQVRSAYQEATQKGTVGQALHGLTQAALHAGKRVHAETSIDDEGASMVTLAMEEALAAQGLGGPHPLEGRSALVLGAGAMASLAATHLGRLGVGRLVLANRTRSRAERLAEHAREAGVTAEVVDFEQRGAVIGQVDMVVSATGADYFTVTPGDVAKLPGPLTLIDLSLPRDIAPHVGNIEGMHLVNIERLHRRGTQATSAVEEQARAIVDEEMQRFTSEQRVRDVAPAVTALRRHAADLIDAELERLRGRAPDMAEGEYQEVSRTVRRVVDKLLHAPTVRVKELAVTSGVVSYESALQELFNLEPTPARSVALPASDLPRSDFPQ